MSSTCKQGRLSSIWSWLPGVFISLVALVIIFIFVDWRELLLALQSFSIIRILGAVVLLLISLSSKTLTQNCGSISICGVGLVSCRPLQPPRVIRQSKRGTRQAILFVIIHQLPLLVVFGFARDIICCSLIQGSQG